MTATFNFAATGSPGDDGFDIDLMTAPPIAPLTFAPTLVSSVTRDNPLLVTSIPEVDTDQYALHGSFTVHRSGSAMLIGGGLYSSHYTETIDLTTSTVSSVEPLVTSGKWMSIEFSTPQPYLLLADTAPGLFVNDGDIFNFSSLNDHVVTTDHREIINLGAGDDSVASGGGNDIIDGGAGIDTSAYAGDRAAFTLTAIEAGYTIADPLTGDVDTLINVERLQFDDGRVAIDIDPTNSAGGAYRIYQAAFDRTPDIGGLTFWVEKADLGMSTIDMAARFIDSDEFRSLYGSSDLPADAFVEQIYLNVLHRSADTGGLDYWLGKIGDGMSEAEVLARFADSPENRANVVGIIDDGIALNAVGDYSNPTP